jgi:hypothetical protein
MLRRALDADAIENDSTERSRPSQSHKKVKKALGIVWR